MSRFLIEARFGPANGTKLVTWASFFPYNWRAMLTIRPFAYHDADYEILVAIDNAAFTTYELGANEWRHQDESRKPDRFFRRDLIERDGRAIAYGQVEQTPDPDKFFILSAVHPADEAPDIRPAYLAHLLEMLAPYGPQMLRTGALDSQRQAVAFWETNGFEAVLREHSSELEVASFEAKAFEEVAQKVRASGVEILSLRALQARDPDWKPKLYELFYAILADVPATEPVEKPPAAEFEQGMLSGPAYNIDSWLVAIEGGQYVGMSQGRPNQVEPDQMYGGLTGVLASHRRRGIATALKLQVIEYARQGGVKHMVVFNEENNPMYQLNLKLGFQPKSTWITYEKRLAADP